MLLSSWTLSKNNDCLTIDTIKWMLKHSISMDINTLYQLKAGQNADHPLMAEESLYDDLPVEVLGLFVMEPYFPRKHFNRAFAWLFGKESIEQIDAESFSHYEKLVSKNSCYALNGLWEYLPFTNDEYRHVFSEINKLHGINDSGDFSECRRGLAQHSCITLDIYRLCASENAVHLHRRACTEVADEHINKYIDATRTGNDRLRRSLAVFETVQMRDRLRLDNVSMDKRDEILSLLGAKEIGWSAVKGIYSDRVPDSVFKQLVEQGVVSSSSVRIEPSILADIRFSKDDATKIAFMNPIKFAPHYLRRSDLDEGVRKDFILSLMKDGEGKGEVGSLHIGSIFSSLVNDNKLTREEIDLFKDAFPEATTTKRKHHIDCDIPIFIDAVRFLFTGKRLLDSKDAINLNDVELTDALYNTQWTKDLLFELLEISRVQPANLSNRISQYNLRRGIVRKLFCESVYPSLDGGDLTGPYGRAENILARVLDGDAALLDEFDVNVIINSSIRLDYADSEVNLAASLARDPDINERIVSERLRLRVEQLSDNPAPTLARQRPAL